MKRAGLTKTVIGRYSGLGSKAHLEFLRADDNDEPLHWLVTPQGRHDQKIGSLNISFVEGSLYLPELEFEKPVAHNDIPDLYLRVVRVIPASDWLPEGDVRRQDTIYEVRYGLTVKGKIIWSDPRQIKYSASGRSLTGPFQVSNAEWPMAYVVATAIGYWGEQQHDLTRYAYHVRSVVRQLELNFLP